MLYIKPVKVVLILALLQTADLSTMATKSPLLPLLLCLLAFGVNGFPRPHRIRIDTEAEPLSPSFGLDTINRSSFHKDFVFGAATAAYQIEGAWNVDGKGLSNWDVFSHKYPEKIVDRSNGDVAIDSYHRYKEDVRLMKEMGLNAYRFSIAWSRILPRGKLTGGVNEKGIKYYNDLINECLANGLTPYVTLFHWDVPQALEDEYRGFYSKNIVKDFVDYSELCFQRFGDRVKHWITLNEPWTFSAYGYGTGTTAPGRCSHWYNPKCLGGDSGTEPYVVTHNLILAHAEAARVYKRKYQSLQKGDIGITLVSMWFVPYSNSTLDRRAARRTIDFMLGWYLHPITYGDYPPVMRAIVGNRLPKFTRTESAMIKGSYDFLGLNYYTANYAIHVSNVNTVNISYNNDIHSDLTASKDGKLIGAQGGSAWLHVYPRGIYELLLHIKREYKNPHIYITESGVDEVNDESLPLNKALIDNFRIQYYYRHLNFVRLAIKDKVNVTGYFAWSALDNYEWQVGYTVRFGIYYVDFKNGLKRYPKLSAKWFQSFLKK